jgi:hypothetical protein
MDYFLEEINKPTPKKRKIEGDINEDKEENINEEDII